MVYLRRYSLVVWALVFGILIAIYPKGHVYAYLDPGTGSLILQLIIGGLLGSVLFIRLFWGRILRKIRVSGSPVEGNLDPVVDATVTSNDNETPPLT
jgi:hypothetical protein